MSLGPEGNWAAASESPAAGEHWEEPVPCASAAAAAASLCCAWVRRARLDAGCPAAVAVGTACASAGTVAGRALAAGALIAAAGGGEAWAAGSATAGVAGVLALLLGAAAVPAAGWGTTWQGECPTLDSLERKACSPGGVEGEQPLLEAHRRCRVSADMQQRRETKSAPLSSMLASCTLLPSTHDCWPFPAGMWTT